MHGVPGRQLDGLRWRVDAVAVRLPGRLHGLERKLQRYVCTSLGAGSGAGALRSDRGGAPRRTRAPPGDASACAANTYKTALSNAACAACPSNSVTLGLGATALAQCVCDVGNGGIEPTSCGACPVGTYKANQANVVCTACPTNSSTASTGATAATQCLCQAGYTGANGGPCTGAPTGGGGRIPRAAWRSGRLTQRRQRVLFIPARSGCGSQRARQARTIA